MPLEREPTQTPEAPLRNLSCPPPLAKSASSHCFSRHLSPPKFALLEILDFLIQESTVLNQTPNQYLLKHLEFLLDPPPQNDREGIKNVYSHKRKRIVADHRCQINLRDGRIWGLLFQKYDS